MSEPEAVWTPRAAVGWVLAILSLLATIATVLAATTATSSGANATAFFFFAALAGWQGSLAACHLRRARRDRLIVPGVLALIAATTFFGMLFDAAGLRVENFRYAAGPSAPLAVFALRHLACARGVRADWALWLALGLLPVGAYLLLALLAGLAMPSNG